MEQTDKTINPLSNEEQKQLYEFIGSIITSIINHNNFSITMFNQNQYPSFIFADGDDYGKEIKKIDIDETFTEEENCLGVGKTIEKDGNYYIVIRSRYLVDLIKSDYKDIYCKYLIYHELGHYINYIINPQLIPLQRKPLDRRPLFEVCRYTFSVAIDEYMANNYISFLLSEKDCKTVLLHNALYSDLDKLYDNINDPFDLFTRFWNAPNAIYKNLIGNIPLFIKSGGFREMQDLEIINIKSIISILEKPEPQLNILFNHLVRIYNIFVTDYNSDNPLILQKTVKLQME
jgi:hypothetical protein